MLEANTNYQKLLVYKDLLKVLYNNGKLGANQPILPYNSFKKLIDAAGKRCSHREAKEFLALLQYLKIIQEGGINKVTNVNYEKAQETLENYLTVDID